MEIKMEGNVVVRSANGKISDVSDRIRLKCGGGRDGYIRKDTFLRSIAETVEREEWIRKKRSYLDGQVPFIFSNCMP